MGRSPTRGRGYSPPYRGHSRSRSPVRRRDEGATNPGNNLYVAGLSTRVTERDLEDFFSKEGKVIECRLVIDPRTRESRGFGFVTMETLDEADRCVKYLDRAVLEGRIITIEKAKRKRARTPTPGEYHGVRARNSSSSSRYPSSSSSRRELRDRERERDRDSHRSRRSPQYSPYRSTRDRSRSPRYSPYRGRGRDRSRSPYRGRDRSKSPYRGRDRSKSPYRGSSSHARERSRSPRQSSASARKRSVSPYKAPSRDSPPRKPSSPSHTTRNGLERASPVQNSKVSPPSASPVQGS